VGHTQKLCPFLPKYAGKAAASLEPEAESEEVSSIEWNLCYLDKNDELCNAHTEQEIDQLIASLEEGMRWEKVKMTVDSGSADTVGPPTLGEGIPIAPTKASRAGKKYRAANSTTIVNLGEKKLRAQTQEEDSLTLSVQIGDTINKFLGSVSKITKGNNSVIFSPPGYESYIYNWTTGKKTGMREENGVYALELWIQVPNKEANTVDNPAEPPKSGFARQARPLI